MEIHHRSELRPPGLSLSRVLWLFGAVLSFLAAGLALQFLAVSLKLPPLGAVAMGQVGILFVALLFAAVDGEGFHRLGIFGSWRAYDFGIIIGIILLHFVGSAITGALMMMGGEPDLEQQAAGVLLKSFGDYDSATFLLIALGLALQSGIGEELLFRGYVISRLERLGLSAWPAILTSALLFGLVHWPGYGLLASMSKAVWFGIPTGAFFWYRRSLGQVMVAHASMNFFGFVVAHIATRYLRDLL